MLPPTPRLTPGRYSRPFLLLLLLSLLVGTAVAQTPAPIFVNVSQPAGLTNNRIGTEKAIGQAWGDYNNDGWPDIYVTDHNGPNTLYQNNGNGTFSVSGLSSSVALPNSYSGGATFIDFNNDGWRDLYVLNWGQNILYQNIGGTQFLDITAQSGVGDENNGKTAAWGDYDKDGFVDLYVANWSCYPQCGRPSSGDRDRLYHNNGNGTFSDATNLLGGKIVGAGFVASFTDYDNDGDLDIYLVNDEFINPIGNGLWRNDGPGCDGWCFVEISQSAGADTLAMGMGLATADYDNDGDQDFYFSNSGPMTLLQNQGNGTFNNVASLAGVDSSTNVGWGSVFFDYDNDGWQDLYLAVSDTTQRDAPPANPLFHNNRNGTFSDVSTISGANDPGSTLGVAYADYDRDGRLDLLVGNIDTGYMLYHNESLDGLNNHWMAFDLVGAGPVNRDAVGSRIIATTPDGQTRMMEVISGASLGAGNELILHFGLGQNQTADIQIIWPNGTSQSFQTVSANKHYRLSYPTDTQAVEAQRLVLYGPPPEPQSTTFNPTNLQLVLASLVISLIIVTLVWLWRKPR